MPRPDAFEVERQQREAEAAEHDRLHREETEKAEKFSRIAQESLANYQAAMSEGHKGKADVAKYGMDINNKLASEHYASANYHHDRAEELRNWR